MIDKFDIVGVPHGFTASDRKRLVDAMVIKTYWDSRWGFRIAECVLIDYGWQLTRLPEQGLRRRYVHRRKHKNDKRK